MRNWKERWDPDAEYVFLKRLKLGLDPKNPWVLPGDPVPKDELGLRRLHRWWDAQIIGLDKERVDAPKPRIVRITQNCFEVRVPGKKIIRVNDKQEAEGVLRAITGELDNSKPQDDSLELPYIQRLNKLMWALHTKDGVEKIKGADNAMQRLHEVANG